MTTIPEHIMEQAEAVSDEIFRLGKFRDAPVPIDPNGIIASALLAAEKRGREESAKIADGMSARALQMSKDESQFNKFERRDLSTMSIAYAQSAAAIRSGQ